MELSNRQCFTGSRETGTGHFAVHPANLFQSVPRFLDFRCHFLGVFAASVVDHASPEGTGANFTWHQI